MGLSGIAYDALLNVFKKGNATSEVVVVLH